MNTRLNNVICTIQMCKWFVDAPLAMLQGEVNTRNHKDNILFSFQNGTINFMFPFFIILL